MDDREGVPWVPLPERLDRRLRLGPFASGRDALKFVTAAAVGAVVSLVVEPWAGLPVVAGGAVVALWHPDGEALDGRLAAFARWAARRSSPVPSSMTGVDLPGTGGGRPTIVLPDGRLAAVVRAGGIPLAFLPPTELARQFDLYRGLLRSLSGNLIVVATASPIYPGAVTPPARPLPPAEQSACRGYRELVTLLARRRSVRRVLLALAQEEPGVEGGRRLEAAAELLRARLGDLGVTSERLHGRALAEAARRIGLVGATSPP
jgi:hypothetical protein